MKKTLIVVGVVTIMAAFTLMFDSSPKPLVCDKFDVQAEFKDGVIRFHIDSDLPDDTEVRVRVSRTYKEKGDSETYAMDYFNSKGTLSKWKTDQFVALNNNNWKRSLKKHQIKVSRLGFGFDVASVSSKVKLSAVVPIGQSNSLFGERNSYLSGKEVSNSGGKVVSKAILFEFPMNDPPVGKSPVPNLNPMDLDVGAIYTLEKQTPLMPHYNPKNPALAIRQMKYIPWESQIKILKKKIVRNNYWYLVSAQGSNGKRIGNGWINSIALLGQKLNGKYK